MTWDELVSWLQKIEATSLRNVKTELLAQMLGQAVPTEVRELIYLVLGGLRPAYDHLEFSLAEKSIVKALGVTWEEYKKVGDLGELVGEIGSRKQELGIREVYEELEKIAQDRGIGSAERKITRLTKLIATVGAEGAKYVVRIVAGKLRLGFSEQTVIDSISYLESNDKTWSSQLERAFQIHPDVGELARAVKEMGIEQALKEVNVRVGVPIVPALAQRLKTADEMIEKMGVVYGEPKYDGTRVQIHYKRNGFGGGSGSVKTFTRNLDESSAQFPELSSIGEQVKADEVILDSEAVGYDPKTNKLLPFQLTITRKRKHGVGKAQSAVPLRFFVFDIMYLDGESLIKLPLLERKKILNETIGEGAVLQLTEWEEIGESTRLRAYHAECLTAGLEGAVIKQKGGEYLLGRTGFNWVKFKEREDSEAKLVDTIDAMVLGYYRGRGKRQKFGWGAMLVGVAGESGQILTIGKVGTGITDSQFVELYEKLQKLEINKKDARYEVEKTLVPDVWVEPKLVVELAADEITRSPIHTAGLALRFPRLVRVREDKGIGEITTKSELEGMQ